jgi:predicted transposase YbfD/YdcC
LSKKKFEKVIKKLQAEFKKLRKFCKYIKKVFKFEEIVKAQKDSRKKRNHETSVIFIIVFWGFVFRVPSFNKLEEMIKYGCFNPLFPRKTILPSIDTIGKVLARLDLGALERSFQKIISTLYINKNFNNGTIDGKTVCAMDGTDIIHTNTKKCPNCMYMKNAEGYYYAHKSVVAMVVGREINYVIGETSLNVKEEYEKTDKKTYENKVITKSEGEFTGAMKLLPTLPAWVDIIVADALYFKAPFIKEILKSSKHAVIRLKDKTSNAYDTINHTAIYKTNNDSFTHKENNKNFTVDYWYKDTVVVDSTILKNAPGKKTDIRLYKFVEVTESTVKGEEKFMFREIYIGTTDKNLSAKTIWKIIHYRWYIENTCFHQLKTHCSMDHCFIHDDTAIQAIVKIMCMAFNIFRSFLFKRLKIFKEDFKNKKATISWFIQEMLIELTSVLLLLRLEIIDIDFFDIPINI